MKKISLIALLFCLGGCRSDETYNVDNTKLYVQSVEKWSAGPGDGTAWTKKYFVRTSAFNLVTDSVYTPGDTLYITINRFKQ